MRRSWLRLFLAGVVVVGAVAAYIVSTQLGERLLHREIETQLTRLLAGPVEIGEVEVHFEGGLRIEARRVEAQHAIEADLVGAPHLLGRTARAIGPVQIQKAVFIFLRFQPPQHLDEAGTLCGCEHTGQHQEALQIEKEPVLLADLDLLLCCQTHSAVSSSS